MEISRIWATSHCLFFWQCLGTVMALLDVSFSLLIEDQGLVFSASWSHLILISLCCVLGLGHSFKSCALPLSLLLQFHPQIFFCKRKNVSSLVSIQGLHVVFGSVSLYCLCLQRSLVCLCHSWPGSLSRLSPDKVVLVLKKPPANAGDIRDVGSIPGSWRSPGGGHGNPLQYSHGQRSLVGYSS